MSALEKKRLLRRPGTAFKVIDGEGVVVLPHTGEYKVLNGVGTRVWELLDGSRDAQAIIERVCDEYEVSPEKAQSDVLEFLRTLEENRMLAEPGGRTDER